ncbi:uncharacterized protein EV422DRAFT_501108, partial [Fimicolochytrium jonesii]|uniref:uncharacterized protein n=1 Tax=Fimicolochytrium jonesii TaxID=1396493 RepID=UPI0022FEA15B
WARTKRKNAENPFILPSVGATLYAMYRMTSSMLRSDKVGFQQSQQTRVAFQFLAIGALVGGIWCVVWVFRRRM